jgi:hypothetical protein
VDGQARHPESSRETRVGRYLMNADPFPGKDLNLGRLRRRGVRWWAACSRWTAKTRLRERRDCRGGCRDLGDRLQGRQQVGGDPEVKDAHGGVMHRRGRIGGTGLYFVGRSWQWTRARPARRRRR